MKTVIKEKITMELREFLKDRFGEQFGVGKERSGRIPSNAFVQFFHEMPNAKGQYRRYLEDEGPTTVQVRVPEDAWQDMWHEWFSEFVSGNSTEQVLQEFTKEHVMPVLMHEVTHLVNDIMGDTHQNTALLKQGKGYHSGTGQGNYAEQILDKVGSNLFHLSRTSEIQTYASQIAWGLAEDVLTNRTYDNNPELALETLDYIIKDLSQGYGTSTTLLDKKKLLGQIVRNLEKYKQNIQNRIEKQ